MARRGRFGRLPRTSPNITNTLVAIAREMQNQRDQNLMDAWQKGGTFEGKPATDELVLAHWHERLKGVERADPLYDTYKNSISQYEYAIAESKASTEYAQGKRSDSQMASFYLNWSKKVPHNTEFYRVLQRDGAQFMRAAKAKSDAAAKAAQEKAYQDAQSHTAKSYEAGGQYITEVLTLMAKSKALVGMDGNANLTNFDPTDPSAMLGLLTRVMSLSGGSGGHGNVPITSVASATVLYHDPLTGKPVTGGDIVAKMKALDPHFDGNLTLDYVSSTLARQLEGQGIRLQRADSTGHATDVNNIKQWQAYTSEVGREAKAWPIEQSYQVARDTFLGTWSSATASPESKLAAWKTYSGALGRLANDPRIAADDATQSRLRAEIAGNANVDSLAESFTGLGSANAGQGGGPQDIGQTHAWVDLYTEQQKAVASGAGVWTYGAYDNAGVFTAGKGNEIGAATYQDAQNAGPSGAVLVYIPQTNGAKPIPVYVPGKPVTAEVVDQDGFKVNPENPNASVIGKVYDLVLNGQPVKMYSYMHDGQEIFTRDAPWGQGVGVENGPNGTVLHVQVTLPKNAVTGAVDPKLIGLDNPFLKTDAKGNIFVNPLNVITSSDPARAKAGVDPLTDSFSPTIAALLSMTDGPAVLGELAKDPVFKAQLDAEARYSAGMQFDQTTGVWTGGDPSVFANNQVQATVATRLPETQAGISNWLADFNNFWNRTTTKETLGSQAQGPLLPGDTRSEGRTMPADSTAGTQFAALGSVFQPSTNLFNPATQAPTGQQVQVAGTIKVPAVPTIAAPTPAPAPAPAPTVMGAPTPLPTAPPVGVAQQPGYTPPPLYTGRVR